MSFESNDPYEFILSQTSSDFLPKGGNRGRKKTKIATASEITATFTTNTRPVTPRKRTESVPVRTPSTRTRKSATVLIPTNVSPSKISKQSKKSANDSEFLPIAQSGFSQFVETKKVDKKEHQNKRKRNVKKKKNQDDDEDYDGRLPKVKRSKPSKAVTSRVDIELENISDEVKAIEQMRLIYETPAGRTNLNKVAENNTKLVDEFIQRQTPLTTVVPKQVINKAARQQSISRTSEKHLNELAWLNEDYVTPQPPIEIVPVVDYANTSATFIPDSLGFFTSAHDNNDTLFQEKIEKLNEKMAAELPILLTIHPTKKMDSTTTNITNLSVFENVRTSIHLTNDQTIQTETAPTKDEISQTDRQPSKDQIIQTNILISSVQTQCETTAEKTTTKSTNTTKIHVCSSTTQTLLEENVKLDQSVQTLPLANQQDHLPHHTCCRDIIQCPCVQLYGKTERFFMQTLSTFFNRIRSVNNGQQQRQPRRLNVRRSLCRKGTIRSSKSQQPQILQQEEEEYRDISQENNIDETTINENYNVIEATPFPQHIVEQNTVQPNQILDNSVFFEDDKFQHQNDNKEITITDEPDLRSFSIVKEDTVEQSSQNIEHFSEVSSIEMVRIAEKESPLLFQPLDLRQENNNEEKWKHMILTSSSLNEQQKFEFDKFINYFNIEYSPVVNNKTTHLITDEEGDTLACPLTGKVIQAISRHMFIVSYRWIIKCLEQKHYVDEIAYEIRGDLSCDQIHNGMFNSRTNPQNLLFNNYAFILKCSGCLPFSDNQPLIELIQLCGGLVIKNLSDNAEHRQKLILCSQEFFQNKKSFSQLCTRLNILCCKPQWLLVSITKYEIVPFKDYEIKRI